MTYQRGTCSITHEGAIPTTCAYNFDTFDEQPFLARLQYLIDSFFCGDDMYAAIAANVNLGQLRRLLQHKRKLTVPIVAGLVMRLGVRPEWLLFGSGTIFDWDSDLTVYGPLQMPATLHSAFACLDTAAGRSPAELEFCGPPGWRAVEEHHAEDSAPYFAAAKVVYTAQTAKKPLGFFLGCEALAQNICKPVSTLFQTYGAQFLVLTLSAAYRDAKRIEFAAPVPASMLQVAQIAARHGIGYAEAFGRWSQPATKKDASLLATLLAAGIPAAVVVEYGELLEHATAPLRGAEMGAATGAAAYVDFLIAAKQFETLFHTTEGVLCVAGEEERALRFLYRQCELFQNRAAKFTAIVFAPPSARLAALVSGCGGTPIFLPHDYGPALTRLLDACEKVYAGQLS